MNFSIICSGDDPTHCYQRPCKYRIFGAIVFLLPPLPPPPPSSPLLPPRQPLQHISAAGQCNASTPDVFPFSEFWEWCVCNHGSDPFGARKEVDVAQSLSMAPCGLREVSADFCLRQTRSDPCLQGTAVSYHCTNNHDTYVLLCFYITLEFFYFFSIAKAMQKKPKKEQKCNTLLTSPNPLFPPLSQCDLLSEIRSVKQLHCAERLMENVYINRIFCIIIIIIEWYQVFWVSTHVIYNHTESPSFQTAYSKARYHGRWWNQPDWILYLCLNSVMLCIWMPRLLIRLNSTSLIVWLLASCDMRFWVCFLVFCLFCFWQCLLSNFFYIYIWQSRI